MESVRGKPSYRLILEAPKRVLVAEDDLATQETLKALCQRIDHRIHVECVTHAGAAERLVRHGKLYDLLIIDLHLAANSDGLDIWRSCHKTFPNLKFIYTSAITPEEFQERAGTKTPPAFLPKPFSILECTGMLREFLVAAA